MDNIIDLHNHTLPGVDDGAKTIEEAIENINYLKERNITDIVFTSHYIVNSKYEVSVAERKKILTKLKKYYKDDNINFYLGNEVYVSDSNILLDLLKNNKLTTLNNSRYMLIEFSLTQKLQHVDQLLCELNEHGIVPIIAHPERYHDLQKNYKKIYELLEYDCLLQCNIGSLSGQYGREAKKYVKWLLKHNLVSILATDFHHITKKEYLNKGLKKLNKLVSLEKRKDLLCRNPKLVLEDTKIDNMNYTVL